MKKREIVIHFLVLLVLTAAFAGLLKSTGTQESKGEYIDDSVITNQGKSPAWRRCFLQFIQDKCRNFPGHGSTQRLR